MSYPGYPSYPSYPPSGYPPPGNVPPIGFQPNQQAASGYPPAYPSYGAAAAPPPYPPYPGATSGYGGAPYPGAGQPQQPYCSPSPYGAPPSNYSSPYPPGASAPYAPDPYAPAGCYETMRTVTVQSGPVYGGAPPVGHPSAMPMHGSPTLMHASPSRSGSGYSSYEAAAYPTAQNSTSGMVNKYLGKAYKLFREF